jgi:hypothetical protein
MDKYIRFDVNSKKTAACIKAGRPRAILALCLQKFVVLMSFSCCKVCWSMLNAVCNYSPVNCRRW